MMPRAPTLEVKDAPYPEIGPEDVIVKTAAVAVNPIDEKIQAFNPNIPGRTLHYPLILGYDVAGTICELGANVKTHKVGDRVILCSRGPTIGEPARSGFQHYVLSPAAHTVLLPEFVKFEQAVVLPLVFDTAASGLFAKDQLGLSLSKLGLSSDAAPATGSTVLIWGGASSVGCSAIQLAHAAGYEVFTTASKHNHELCASLGASKVFDYSDNDVETEIATALKDKTLVGALDCIANVKTTMQACANILAQTDEERKLVTVLSPPSEELAAGVKAIRGTMQDC